jgi:putative Holliday junction resolvase
VRIGVAYSDPEGIMAIPMTTVIAGKTAIAQVAALAVEYQADVIYVGNPVNLSGAHTKSTESAQGFATELQGVLGQTASVRLIDERLSTVSAQRGMQDIGKTQKASRNVIDQAAAVIILEQALEIEKRSENLAGISVGDTIE